MIVSNHYRRSFGFADDQVHRNASTWDLPDAWIVDVWLDLEKMLALQLLHIMCIYICTYTCFGWDPYSKLENPCVDYLLGRGTTLYMYIYIQ